MTITPASGHDLPETVNVVGASASYDSSTGVISLSNPTANVAINATCPEAAPTPSLTPFEQDDVITAITVDPTASVDEIASWLSLQSDGALATVSYTALKDDGTPTKTKGWSVETLQGHKAITIDLFHSDGDGQPQMLQFFNEGFTVGGITIAKGWNVYSEENGAPSFAPIEQETTFTFDATEAGNITITSVTQDFAEINGVCIGNATSA